MTIKASPGSHAELELVNMELRGELAASLLGTFSVSHG